MIVVDSSVWIDYFRGTDTPEAARLDELLGEEPLALGELMLAEVLQGFRNDRDFREARDLLLSLTILEMVGTTMALRAAENYRTLRRRGVSVRKTVDTLIVTYCIEHGHSLLFTDRDFQPFVRHLGLRSAMTWPT